MSSGIAKFGYRSTEDCASVWPTTLGQPIQIDLLARQYDGRQPLRQVLLLPEKARAPAPRYLGWQQRGVLSREPRPAMMEG
jgi:hypothetical protein